MNEEWEEFIEGYSVSNFGNMRSNKKGILLIPQKRYKKSEHLSVHIKGKNYSVSREVATRFVQNPDNLPIVRHWDGNQRNNHYTNLKWGTQKDNTEDAIRHGTHTCLTSEGFKAQKNAANTPSKVKRNPKSGIKGISIYNGKKTKYRVNIACEKIGNKYLGSYDTVEEAEQIHRDAYFKIYGVYP